MASRRLCHCLNEMATAITRRPSFVTKSRPNAPYMSLPIRLRSSRLIWASAMWPSIATVHMATSASAISTSCPEPSRERVRSAARRPRAVIWPQITSQAGSTWLAGEAELSGPVTNGYPTAQLTV